MAAWIVALKAPLRQVNLVVKDFCIYQWRRFAEEINLEFLEAAGDDVDADALGDENYLPFSEARYPKAFLPTAEDIRRFAWKLSEISALESISIVHTVSDSDDNPKERKPPLRLVEDKITLTHYRRPDGTQGRSLRGGSALDADYQQARLTWAYIWCQTSKLPMEESEEDSDESGSVQ